MENKDLKFKSDMELNIGRIQGIADGIDGFYDLVYNAAGSLRNVADEMLESLKEYFANRKEIK